MKTNVIDKVRDMKCFCNLCSTLKWKVLECENDEEVIKVIKNYDGFICGAVETMRTLAYE